MLKLISKSEEETQQIGKNLAKRVHKGMHILLFGNLGTGKTRFIQGFCMGKGVNKGVKSPTYTLMNSHKTKNETIFHYDLYRLSEDAHFDHLSMSEDFEDEKAIVIVEWADRLPKKYYPDERIEVYIEANNETEREITLKFPYEKTPSIKEIHELWEKYHCPKNIRDHMEQVKNVALEFGKKLIEKKEIVNLDLIEKSALLHDILRLVNVKIEDLNPKLVNGDVDEETHNRWAEIQKNYPNMDHEEAASLLLKEAGFIAMSEIVRKHRFDVIEEEDIFKNWEEKLVYYADKRVLHDKIVTLDERFADSLERHHKGESNEKRERLIKRCYALEREIAA